MEHKEKIKKFMAIALLPIPLVIYFVGFFLKIQKPEYIAFASLFIIIVILLLLKTEIVVTNETGKRKIHFSLIKEQKQSHNK